MKKKKYKTELFKDFQQKQGLPGDIICYEIDQPLYQAIPRGLDFFSFMLFEHGSGTHTIDFVEYPIYDRQIHLIFPGQVHTWRIEGNVKLHLIFVAGATFSIMEDYLVYPVEYYMKNPTLSLCTENFEAILSEFNGIKRELRNEHWLSEIIFSKFRVISLMVNREMLGRIDRGSYGKPEALFTRFSILIIEYCRENRKVSFYAEKLGISANYLNILCKKHLNMTANSFIAKEVLNEAKHELIISKKSIKEIALELKFNDIAGFSNYFKRHAGISPRQFIIDQRRVD
ncbi:helix-turn-helix domain-containing protein [Sphingobacterium multivorum]|uniref:helix-turn-helix domain-containing protein n=1 Tax=Sphingobacterium multivorum TaxID=28454 RepID=UPI0031BB0097